MNTITIDKTIYEKAEHYAKIHNLSLQSMVEELLQNVISSKPFKIPQALPAKWENLCGILKDVKDDDDERFNYIINK